MSSVDNGTKHLDDKKEAVIMTPLLENKLLTAEKVTTSEEVDKDTGKFYGIKDAVVTIHRKDSNNFEGQSKGSTGWFNLDHEFFKESFLRLNRTSVKKIMKSILKV